MRSAVEHRFIGLKIDWEEDHEIEFLGPAVLSGNASFTASRCELGSRVIHYLYPITVRENTSTRLELDYSANPRNWPKGWDVYKGQLAIDFDSNGTRRPVRLEYRYADDGHVEQLSRGKDWEYVAEDVSTQGSLIKPRGRLQTSRLERPLQQALRNLLLSEHGSCQLTGTRCAATLEACHIVPVKNGGNDNLGNALLLRRDLHVLFDAGLLRFRRSDNEWKIEIDASVEDFAYRNLVSCPSNT